jgi:hypothetical protein
MFKPVDGVQLSSNIELPSCVVQVLYGWVLLVSTEDLLGLLLPVKY